jgi:ABC-type transport system substrate-binding protein
MGGGYWTRFTGARVSRRRWLQGAAAASAGGAIWLAGCGGDSNGGSPSVTTPGSTNGLLNERNPATPGGTLKVWSPATFDSFDPHLGVAASVPFFPRIYNVLVNQSAQRPEFTFFDLAESMENPDATTWSFKIRPGVRIGPNDLGVPERDLDAEDAKATLERIRDTPTATNGAFAKEFIDSMVVNGDVLTVKTTSPYAWFIARAGNFVNTIPPRELLADDASVKKMADASAGGGPYRLTRAVEGEAARFERNPSYYRRADDGSALPYIDALEVAVIPDRSAARTAFGAGQLQYYTSEGKAEAESLLGGGGNFVQKSPAFQFVPLTMNVDKPPFNDARARRAVSRAINRQQIIDLVYEGDAKPNGLVHWPVGEGTYAFTAAELEEFQPYDPQEARQLVEAVGGLKFDAIFPAEAPVVQHNLQTPIIMQQLEAIGIEVEQKPMALPSWLDAYRKRDYQLSVALTQQIDTPEFPLNWHAAKGPTGDGTSFGHGLGDADIEAALTKSRTTLDFEARVEAVREAQRVIYAKDPMFLPLVCGYVYTLYSDRLHNVTDGLGASSYLLNTMWLET